jgi:hypothetical protein
MVPQKDLYSITFLMVVADDDSNFDGITMTKSIYVRPGDDVGDKVAPVIKAFQKKVDDYQAAVAIQGTQAMTDAIVAIGSGVSV